MGHMKATDCSRIAEYVIDNVELVDPAVVPSAVDFYLPPPGGGRYCI